MSEKKIAVPNVMKQAAYQAAHISEHSAGTTGQIDDVLEAALLRMIEKPIFPTDEVIAQAAEDAFGNREGWGYVAITNMRKHFMALQRLIFLAPEPESGLIPEHIRDLLPLQVDARTVDIAVEAYARGQKAGTNAGK